MNTKLIIFMMMLMTLPLLLGGCMGDAGVFIISFGTPDSVEIPDTATPTATMTPVPTATPTPTPTPTPIPCVNTIEQGRWSGSVLTSSMASRSGFNVIQQQAELLLAVQVNCDGSVVGTASRAGEASINVPLTLNGVCADTADYDVTGTVRGTQAQPVFDLTFLTRAGTLTCDVNSRMESVPSGEQSSDLSGQVLRTQVTASSAGNGFVEGTEWSDRVYQDNLSQLDELIEEAGLEVSTTAAWRLERQGP